MERLSEAFNGSLEVLDSKHPFNTFFLWICSVKKDLLGSWSCMSNNFIHELDNILSVMRPEQNMLVSSSLHIKPITVLLVILSMGLYICPFSLIANIIR